ncbi:hypothetical protein [Nonomuraea fuscirosea]|uniref:hypothetical protein n=1 Tax=Nonomuraea fuscirosea TaxID=1291556 RepID=UPI00343CD8F1
MDGGKAVDGGKAGPLKGVLSADGTRRRSLGTAKPSTAYTVTTVSDDAAGKRSESRSGFSAVKGGKTFDITNGAGRGRGRASRHQEERGQPTPTASPPPAPPSSTNLGTTTPRTHRHRTQLIRASKLIADWLAGRHPNRLTASLLSCMGPIYRPPDALRTA